MEEEIKNLSTSWKNFFQKRERVNLNQVSAFLEKEYENKEIIYPCEDKIFEAFKLCSFESLKLILLGQDPYHGSNQAHGLSFSVPRDQRKIPPSLRNIFKEIESDINIKNESHGNLEKWAAQGVLLLNSVLTVRSSQAASHKGKGWEEITDELIKYLSEEKSNLVFLLWGAPAQKKEIFIDQKKHLVLKAPHPSPLSSYRGFFGCKHFSKANQFLKENNLTPIDWRID